MKNILIIIATFFLLFQSAFSDLVIIGQILTHDSKSPKMAHVSYLTKSKELKVIQTDSEGFFEFLTPNSYLMDLTFAAVDHISVQTNFPIPQNLDTLLVSIKLKPNQIYDDLENITIVGNFNDRSFNDAITMERKDDGKYYFEIEYDSDTLSYQIIPKFTKNFSDRSYNGSQSDGFEYDMNGDYNSLIIDKTKKFKVVFDPAYYPQGTFKSVIEFSDDEYSEEFNNYSSTVKEYNNYIRDRSMIYIDESIPNEDKNEKSLSTKKDYLTKIEETINKIKDKNIRILGIIQYLDVAHDGVTVTGIEDYVNKNLIKEILAVSPESDIWDINSHYYNVAFAEILLGNIENPEYLFKIINTKHPDPIKAGLLSVLVDYCHYNGLDELKDKYYTQLQSDYSHTKEAKYSKSRFGKDKVIIIGKTIPKFEFKNLDNENEIITDQTLRGKYVLVDIWGTWCFPCLMEIPNLVDAYNKFKDKNFTIYSIAVDASASVVKKFRESKNKFPWMKKDEQIETNLPWLHSYGGNWDSDFIGTFEVVGVPTTFLIDPEGKIIDIDNLRGESLIETLNKFIK